MAQIGRRHKGRKKNGNNSTVNKRILSNPHTISPKRQRIKYKRQCSNPYLKDAHFYNTTHPPKYKLQVFDLSSTFSLFTTLTHRTMNTGEDEMGRSVKYGNFSVSHRILVKQSTKHWSTLYSESVTANQLTGSTRETLAVMYR